MGKGETLIHVARNRRKLYHDSRQRRQREDKDQRAIWFARAPLHVVGGGSAALSSAMRLIRVCARDARSINVTRRCTKRTIRERVTMRDALFLFRGTKNIFAPSRARRKHQ